MNTIVRCPVTGRACSEGTCRERHWARTRPVAHRAAFETQIPTEVLRQNSSRSPVHHEGGAGKAALPIPRRAVDRSQDRGRQSPDSRCAAATLESAPRGKGLTAAGCGLPVASNVPVSRTRWMYPALSPKYAALVAPCRRRAADFRFRPQTDSTAARAGGNWGISAVSLPLALPREMLKNQMQAISLR